MSKSTLELRGRVVQTGTDTGIPDLRVVVVDQEAQIPTMMFRAVTDETGAYCIELSRDEAASLFPPGQGQVWDAQSRLYISVYNGDALLLTTHDTLEMHDIARGAFPTVLEVNVHGTADIQFSVHGRVVQADGSPVGDARIRVERVEAASRTVVAAGNTETDGTYDLSYAGVDASTGTATNTAIVVIVDDSTSGDEVVRTPVIVDPDPRHLVDLLAAEIVDYTGQPEFARVLAAFEPWVSANALPNLSSDDLELLVKRSGMPADQVAMAIQAQRIATARGIPAEASYALMRAGMPADVPGQLAQSRERIRGALQAALDGNLVDSSAFDVETVVSLYTTRKVEAVLTGSDPALLNLVSTSGLSPTATDTFLTRWIEHEGTRDEFWSALESGSEFSASDVDTLRFTTESTAIVNGFQPALVAIQAERVAGSITTTRDLAGWAASDWSTFAATHGAPDDLPGDPAEREALYAATLDRVVEEQFPTERLARRLEVSPLAETVGVPEFIDANADFDITKTVVAAYLEENPAAVPTGFDPETTEANLKRVQRVFTLTPRFHRYDVTRVLMDEGIDSAASVVHIGKAAFVERFGPLLDSVHDGMTGEQAAKSVYASALQKHGFSLALMAQYGASMNTISIDAIPATAMAGDEGPGAATLASLFGSLDYCACEHCRSMFSPAAYLVDLLSRLEALDAYTPFYNRRGDISHLELSCENTNTVLPYIDIVNEVLEDAVLNPGARPTTRQTSRSAEELRLNPEPTGNEAAYDLCAAAVYPWSLPVDVPAVETREHLKRLGFTRADAMALFDEDGAGVVVTQDAQTAERLGMSTLEFELATQAPADGWERWGFDFSESGIWLDTLAGDVPRVLEATSLEFEELARLLTMRTVTNNFAISATLELGPPGDNEPTCDITELSVRGFDDRAADTIHRFIRLSRRVDASWRELDIMFEAFGGMTAAGLGQIVEALQVRSSLGIPLEAGIWSNLDEHSYDGEPSVFARMFQSNKVLAEAEGEFSLGGVLDEVAHFAHLRSGLGINDSDLRALLRDRELIDEAGNVVTTVLGPDGEPEDVVVDIEFVSDLYAHTRLAAALDLRISDLIRYLALVDFDPVATPHDTMAFADIVRDTEASQLGLNGSEYLATHRSAPELGLQPTDSDFDAVAADIAVAKADVDAQFVVEGSPVEVLRAHAEALLGSTPAVDRLILELSEQGDYPWARSRDEPDFDGSDLTEDEAWLLTVSERLGTVPALASLPLSDEGSFDERFSAFGAELALERSAPAYSAAILDRLATFSSLPQDAISALAVDLVAVPAGSTSSVHDVLLDNYEDVADPSVRAGYYRRALLHLHKASYLVSALGIESRDLRWIFTPIVSPTVAGADTMSLGDLVPAAEPVTPTAAQALFTRIRDVRRWVELLVGFTTSSEQLTDILGEIDSSRSGLAAVTGWDEDDLDWVAGGSSWFDLDATAMRDPSRIAQLREMALAVRRTGVRAEQLAAWARNPPDAAVARDSKQALRARHSEVSWPDVLQPISDRMRELRRDALLDYLVAGAFFESREAVYAYYLLDPEMNACMMTSRIKLALSSVQLFVQRGLMQLEPSVSFLPDFAKEWEWLKNYRVWEANRKVFFYPENWILPELRPGKTPFFAELEGHLQQGGLTDSHIQRGFVDYLTKLHEVSGLAVLDMHEGYDRDARSSVLHIVARTQSEPYRYFYRNKVGNTHWTPWERVEAGVGGEHLILQTYKGRVFLFWLDFVDGAGAADADNVSMSFMLSQTERVNGVWQPKTSSPVSDGATKPTLPFFPYRSKPSSYMLWGGALADGRGFGIYISDTSVVSADGKFDPAWRFRYDVIRGSFEEIGVSASLRDGVLGFVLSHSPDGAGSVAQRIVAANIIVASGDEFTEVASLESHGQSAFVTPCHQDPLPYDGHHPYAVQMPLGPVLVFSGPGGSTVGTMNVARWTQAASLSPNFSLGLEPIDIEGDTLISSAASAELSLSAGLVEPSAQTVAAAELTLSVQPEMHGGGMAGGSHVSVESLCFPVSSDLMEIASSEGVGGLFAPVSGRLRRQSYQYQMFVPEGGVSPFENPVPPVELRTAVAQPYPLGEFDFRERSAYSVYNWELFFHAPMMVASRLRAEGRYADADRWYRSVFDPHNADAAHGDARFWMVKPLFQEANSGDPDVIQSLFSGDGLLADEDVLGDFVKSVWRWTNDPFSPHGIASVRAGTYRWVAVRGYLDNLIDWADALFRRDTVESIGEAAQLYLLAAAVLGKRPEQLREMNVTVESYSTIDGAGLFGGLAEIEGYYPEQETIGGLSLGSGSGIPSSVPEPPLYDAQLVGYASPSEHESPHYPKPQIFEAVPSSGPPAPLWWTFCLPPNPQLLEYWDVVSDRLFKVRNCQNIEGVVRQLALFEPPIDPALLVRARAAGLDPGDLVAGSGAGMPVYRYRAVLRSALELCGDVRALGGALLTTLEKRDGEALSRLRVVHEGAVLTRMQDVRRKQVDESVAQLAALEKARASADARASFYGSRSRVSPKELLQIEQSVSAGHVRSTQASLALVGQTLSVIPTFSVGFNAGPSWSMSFGGSNLAAAFQAASQAAGSSADRIERESVLAGIQASHARRWDDWQHQLSLAELERAQIDKQIVAAEVSVAIAEKELSNLGRQIQQSTDVRAFYENKYTSQELYGWMLGEISRLYFQAYKLAFDMAKKAELAMQFELETDDTFIEFGYWDGLKKGLMAGERLHLDIKRMESAYLDKDKRELELTKRVPLRQVAPGALAELRESGECEFEIPELLFDLDHAGHYLRRMRAVRVTMPAVAGPQTSIGATLTLLRDDLRTEASLEDAAVRTTYGGTKRIATSHAREDGGLFELNFRDERYLPFEGAGVASRWSLRLPTAVRQFDYNTITDVEIRIDYTARDGGASFRDDVEGELQASLSNALDAATENGIAMVLSAKKDFAVDWERFLRPADGQLSPVMELPITSDRFPYLLRTASLTVASVELFMVGAGYSGGDGEATLTSPSEGDLTMSFDEQSGSLGGSFDTPAVVGDQPWALNLGSAVDIDPERVDEVEDLWVIVRFNATLPSSS
ncbi:MAG: neuraminidase-like domain-containing protein [Nannocystales bacterium]